MGGGGETPGPETGSPSTREWSGTRASRREAKGEGGEAGHWQEGEQERTGRDKAGQDRQAEQQEDKGKGKGKGERKGREGKRRERRRGGRGKGSEEWTAAQSPGSDLPLHASSDALQQARAFTLQRAPARVRSDASRHERFPYAGSWKAAAGVQWHRWSESRARLKPKLKFWQARTRHTWPFFPSRRRRPP